MAIKHRKINQTPAVLAPLLSIPFIPFLITSSVLALDYSSNTNVQFTFNPVLNLAVSDNLIIDNLMPGTYSDSNMVDVNVSTNSVTGYSLSATVGSSTNPTTSLVHSINSSYQFTSLTSGITNLSDFSPNTWGYNYSNDNGNTWHNYSSLPLYTTTGTILSEKYLPSNDTIKFKIGTSVDSNQAAGTYTNTINFIATTNPNVNYYMQEFTNTLCSELASNDNYTVYDIRDGNDYTVRYINGQCWMTQNLRYLGDTGSSSGTMTIGNNNSNVENKSITLYSLNASNAGNFNPYSGHCDSTNGYNYACVYDSGNTTTGVWYNYVAATAGTITGSSNSTPVTSDICPSGWHLPSGPNTTANTDFNKLVGNTTSEWQNPTVGLTAFDAVAGGSYYSGSLSDAELGGWWSATTRDTTRRCRLFYDSNNNQFYGNGNYYRFSGYFVRCVMSN